MPTLRRVLFVGCCLFTASFSFCAGFLANLAYLMVVSPDSNRSFSQTEIANAVLMGLGATVLTARIGSAAARSILRNRLQILAVILALAGCLGTLLLAGGLLNYLVSPYF